MFYSVFIWRFLLKTYYGGVLGEGGNQGVARLVLTGCGIAVSEIFGVIREDSR